jgi:ribosomal protein L11 methyltransferase
MKNKEFVEVQLRTEVDAGDLYALLEANGCAGAWETNDGVCCLYWARNSWNPETLRALKTLLQQLGDPTAEKTIHTHDVPDQDWNASWAASLQPIQLGGRVLIRQSWNSAAIPPGGFELVIDPKRAFGTGYHATTQLLAEWLQDLALEGQHVLDLGTGSGILAMIALRLGAGHVLGADIDPEAIECAREYSGVNGFGSELELRVATLDELEGRQFDLLLANLDRMTLPKHFSRFHASLRRGGRLLISGLQQEDYDEISAALAATGWEITGRRNRDEWMALELREAGV